MTVRLRADTTGNDMTTVVSGFSRTTGDHDNTISI
jgi:hypothetical protein